MLASWGQFDSQPHNHVRERIVDELVGAYNAGIERVATDIEQKWHLKLAGRKVALYGVAAGSRALKITPLAEPPRPDHTDKASSY